MKTEEKQPLHCGICRGMRIPLVRSGVMICRVCDGWPPILEPPAWNDLVRPEHVQGCGAGRDRSKRCICPK